MSGRRKWTEEEIEYLGYVVGKQSYTTIARILNRSKESVKHKVYKLGLQEQIQYESRLWTEEEIKYLRKNYHKKSAKTIAKHLKRTVDSVKHAAQRYGALDINIEGLSLLMIAQAFDSDLCVVSRWRDKYDLPVKKRKIGKGNYYSIYGEDFWEWALEHKELVPIHKYQRGFILPEPDDLYKIKGWGVKPSNHRKPVTKKERDYMIFLKNKGMSIKDISKRTDRTIESVRHILFDSCYK